jgi:predicted aspartyl protease
VRIKGLNRNVSFDIETEALIDTGFDGDVIVPSQMVSGSVVSDGLMQWKLADGSLLADGSVIVSPVYLGTAQIAGLSEEPVTISAVGSETLIGSSLVRRFLVTLDHGARVVFEP